MTASRTMTATASMPARRRWWNSPAILVVILGLVLVGRGGWDMIEAIEFANHGVTAEGQLVGINSVREGRGRVGHYAEVRYVVAGKSIQALAEDRFEPAGHRLGEKLSVFYLSTEPQRVRLSADGIGFWPWFILGLGIAVGGGGLAWMLRPRRQA